MIARVFVKQKVRTDTPFDYFVDENDRIDKFSLVEVKFKNIKTLGLVFDLCKKSKYATKPIERKLSNSSIFTPYQVSLSEVMSKIYASTFSDVIFSFLPKLNLKDLASLGAKSNLYKNKSANKELLIAQKNERVQYICQVLKKNKAKGGQSLLIFPTIADVNYVAKQLEKIFTGRNILIYNSKISSPKKAAIWQNLLTGRDAVVVGTRHALFLPFVSLKQLYLDDPSNFAYQEDQAPYYNAYYVSRLLQKIVCANFAVGEDIPSIYSFIGLKRKELKVIELKSDLKIITMPAFKQAAVYPQHIAELKSDVKMKKRILVIGEWDQKRNVFCADCSNTFQQDKNILLCPKCGGSNLKKLGFDKAEFSNFISKISPGYEKQFFLLTGNEVEKSGKMFDTAMLPFFEGQMNRPYLRNRLKLFRLIRSLRSYGVSKVFLYGQIFEENLFVDRLIRNDWKSFLTDELAERKKLDLPPFTRAFLIESKKNNLEDRRRHVEGFIDRIIGKTKVLHVSETENCSAVVFVSNQTTEKFIEYAKFMTDNKIYLKADPLEYS